MPSALPKSSSRRRSSNTSGTRRPGRSRPRHRQASCRAGSSTRRQVRRQRPWARDAAAAAGPRRSEVTGRGRRTDRPRWRSVSGCRTSRMRVSITRSVPPSRSTPNTAAMTISVAASTTSTLAPMVSPVTPPMRRAIRCGVTSASTTPRPSETARGSGGAPRYHDSRPPATTADVAMTTLRDSRSTHHRRAEPARLRRLPQPRRERRGKPCDQQCHERGRGRRLCRTQRHEGRHLEQRDKHDRRGPERSDRRVRHHLEPPRTRARTKRRRCLRARPSGACA